MTVLLAHSCCKCSPPGIVSQVPPYSRGTSGHVSGANALRPPGLGPWRRERRGAKERPFSPGLHTRGMGASRLPYACAFQIDAGTGRISNHIRASQAPLLIHRSGPVQQAAPSRHQLQRLGCLPLTPNWADVTSVRARFSASFVGARSRRVSTSHIQPLTTTSLGIRG